MCRIARILVAALAIAAAAATPRPALAATAAEIDRGVDAALGALYEQIPSAWVLGEQAKAVLVFPNIVEAGFIVGSSTAKSDVHAFVFSQRGLMAGLGLRGSKISRIGRRLRRRRSARRAGRRGRRHTRAARERPKLASREE